MSNFSLTMVYDGIDAAILLKGSFVPASISRISPTPARLSRTLQIAGQITPPLPSPPISAFSRISAAATCASPTGVRTTRAPCRAATSSIILLVERFATTTLSRAPVNFCRSSRCPAVSARVYSSPGYWPFSSTSANRSASGSCANPTSAPLCLTASHSEPRCSRTGSGG